MRIPMTIVSIGMTLVSLTLFAAERLPPKSRTYTVSVSQHVSNETQLSDEGVRKVLAGASKVLKDNACDITFTLEGSVGSFGSLTDETFGIVGKTNPDQKKLNLDAVHRLDESTDANLHVKVVAKIEDFCRFKDERGEGFSGCAWPPKFRSIIVVQPLDGMFDDPPRGHVDPILYSMLWAHELGHLMGLRHSLTPNSLMTPCAMNLTDKEITVPQCLCYLSGPGTSPNGQCDLESVRCPRPN